MLKQCVTGYEGLIFQLDSHTSMNNLRRYKHFFIN